MSAIMEIKTIIEDYRIHVVGGLKSGLDIWEMAIIPSLLNNAETWDEIDEESMIKLNYCVKMFDISNYISIYYRSALT